MRAELNKTFILIIKLIARYEVVGAKSFLRSPELCCPVHTQLFEHENFLRAVFWYLLFMTIWFVSYQSGGWVPKDRAGKGVKSTLDYESNLLSPSVLLRKIRAITLIVNNYKRKEEVLTGSFNHQYIVRGEIKNSRQLMALRS